MCKKKKLDNNTLYVYQVPLSRCVLVTGSAPSTNKDLVESYFDSNSEVGIEVERVDSLQDSGGYLVYFEDAVGDWSLLLYKLFYVKENIIAIYN